MSLCSMFQLFLCLHVTQVAHVAYVTFLCCNVMRNHILTVFEQPVVMIASLVYDCYLDWQVNLFLLFKDSYFFVFSSFAPFYFQEAFLASIFFQFYPCVDFLWLFQGEASLKHRGRVTVPQDYPFGQLGLLSFLSIYFKIIFSLLIVPIYLQTKQ